MLDNFIKGLLMGEDNIYEIHIEYDKNESSSEVFRKTSDLLKAFDDLNNSIASSFGRNIRTNAVIERIEQGSIKVYLRDIIENIPNVISDYVKAPKALLIDIVQNGRKETVGILTSKEALTNKERGDNVTKAIDNLIKNSELSSAGYKLDKIGILKASSSLCETSEQFTVPPKVIINDNENLLSSNYRFNPNDVPDMIEKRTQSCRDIFIIKKPDLVGDSKWSVIFDKVIEVKIQDGEWLKKLKNREISIFCGDGLDAEMYAEIYYNRDSFDIIETHYYITKIYDIKQPLKNESKHLTLPLT